MFIVCTRKMILKSKKKKKNERNFSTLKKKPIFFLSIQFHEQNYRARKKDEVKEHTIQLHVFRFESIR
jgi:hypothetical protein